MPGDRRTIGIGLGLMALAVLVQIQATIPVGGGELRANGADVALAALSPLILIGMYSNFARLKEVAGPHLPILAAAASALMTLSLFHGYAAIAGLSSWAAIKYAGWYVLISYLALGILIAHVADSLGKRRFCVGFIGFQIAMIAAFVVSQYLGYGWMFNPFGKLSGFAGNANAMAFYLICGFAISLAFIDHSGGSALSRRFLYFAAAAIFAGILFTKSVSALIAIISVMLFAAIVRAASLRRLLLIALLGSSLWYMPQVITAPPSMVVNVINKLSGMVQPKRTGVKNRQFVSGYDGTVRLRMEGYRDAIAMWRANPVFGAGLGVHLHNQSLVENPKYSPVVIHNTGLWLLAELGLVGFLVFAAIFVILFHKVWTLARSPPGDQNKNVWFASAVLLILVGWGVMALFHEFMYQRVVWLLVGMALTAPVEPLGFRRLNPFRRKQGNEK